MMFENFLGGISWALGVWIGTTIVITILAFILTQLDFIPFINDLSNTLERSTQQK